MTIARKLYRRLFPARPPRTLASLDAYDLWAANYPPQAHNPLMLAEQAAMLDLMPPLAGQVVLDLACGTGRYGLLAQARGAKYVLGIDNSAAMLNLNPLVNRVQSTSEAVPLANHSVDLVICALALGHLPRLQPSLSEIGRVLKPGGIALVSDLHPAIALAGGQRTFHGSDGQLYAVEHYVHVIDDYQRAGQAAGLQIDALQEPALDSASGAGSSPVVIVFRFRKPAL
ncbi:MAG: class I SAM-dependent methyltransferase [Chloroflexota bacterium]